MDQLPCQRKYLRLIDYDYSQSGAYFITICTHKKQKVFGKIVGEDLYVLPKLRVNQANSLVELNEVGNMIDKWWNKICEKFDDVQLDQHIIMPDHLHGIILIDTTGGHISPPLQTVIQWFKTMTTDNYIKNVKINNWPRFDQKLWERSFYDHVIRNNRDLNEIREYI